jgi:uncharacterized protein (DUF2237 family)
MPVPEGRMRGIRSIRERDFSWKSPQLARIDHLQPSSGQALVALQSTHEAALDVVDLADLKRRAVELI